MLNSARAHRIWDTLKEWAGGPGDGDFLGKLKTVGLVAGLIGILLLLEGWKLALWIFAFIGFMHIFFNWF